VKGEQPDLVYHVSNAQRALELSRTIAAKIPQRGEMKRWVVISRRREPTP
jgi:hypothetical protein